MFDRQLIGKKLCQRRQEIEKGAIRRFAEAIDDPNPLHRDERAARQAGLRGLLAPPTFAASLGIGSELLQRLALDPRRVLIAEQSIDLPADICSGDEIDVSSAITDLYERPGTNGPMSFAVVEDEGRTPTGELVFRMRRILIARPPPTRLFQKVQ